VLIPHFVQNEVDASDSPAGRLSSFNFCNPFDHIMPLADGTINALDRQHLWGLSTVIAAGAPTVSTVKKVRRFISNINRLGLR